MSSFADLGVSADLVAVLARRGITEPFPVQAATIPDALAGGDVCGKAPDRLRQDPRLRHPARRPGAAARPRRPRALVLAPTRELAAQIQKSSSRSPTRATARVSPSTAASATRRRTRRCGAASTSSSRARAGSTTSSSSALSTSTASRSSSSTRPTAWPTWASCPRCARSSTTTADDRQTMLFSATLDGDVARAAAQLPARDAVRHEVADAEPTRPTSTTASRSIDATDRLARDRRARCASTGRRSCSAAPATVPTGSPSSSAHAGVAAAAIHGGLSQGQA